MIPQEWTSLERGEMEMEQRPKFKVIKGGKKGGKRRVVVQQKDEVIENVDILIKGIKKMIRGLKKNQKNINKILEEWEFEHSLRGGENHEDQSGGMATDSKEHAATDANFSIRIPKSYAGVAGAGKQKARRGGEPLKK